jgi:hypothetical protein
MIMEVEKLRIWKVVMAYFKVLSQHFLQKLRKTIQSGYSVT